MKESRLIEPKPASMSHLLRGLGIDVIGFIRIMQFMRQMFILTVLLALFIVPVSTFADEDHIQVLETAVSTQLTDHESGDDDTPAPDRGTEHCGHCVPMPLRTEYVTVTQADDQSSTRLPADNLPRLQSVARAEKPPQN